MLPLFDFDALRIRHQRREILIGIQGSSSFKGKSIVAFFVFARSPKSYGVPSTSSLPLVEAYLFVGFRMNFKRWSEIRCFARSNREFIVLGGLLRSLNHPHFLGVGDIELQPQFVGNRVTCGSRTFQFPQLSINARHCSLTRTGIGFGSFHHHSTIRKLQEIPMHLFVCAHLRHRRCSHTR